VRTVTVTPSRRAGALAVHGLSECGLLPRILLNVHVDPHRQVPLEKLDPIYTKDSMGHVSTSSAQFDSEKINTKLLSLESEST
jgi:hypothetical protein